MLAKLPGTFHSCPDPTETFLELKGELHTAFLPCFVHPCRFWPQFLHLKNGCNVLTYNSWRKPTKMVIYIQNLYHSNVTVILLRHIGIKSWRGWSFTSWNVVRCKKKPTRIDKFCVMYTLTRYTYWTKNISLKFTFKGHEIVTYVYMPAVSLGASMQCKLLLFMAKINVVMAYSGMAGRAPKETP